MKKYIGTTDSINTCDCCGKSDLKMTVAIEHEDESINYYGCICAGKILNSVKLTKTPSDVKNLINLKNELETIQKKVNFENLIGNKVVYGRFYLNERSRKTVKKIDRIDNKLLLKAIITPNYVI